MTVHISDRDALVLRYIAENGPTYGYSLGKLERFTTRLAYAALKSLKSRGCLKLGRIVKDRPGRDTKYYSLTVLGFSHALRLTHADLTEAWKSLIEQKKDLREDYLLKEAAPQAISQLQNIIGQWGDLIPLVLGKWSLFEEVGFAAQVITKLNLAALNQVLREGGPTSWVDLYPSSDPVEVFTYDFFNPFSGIGNRTDRCRWATACAGDPEVLDYLIERLKKAKERYESHAHEVGIMAEVLEARARELYPGGAQDAC